MAGRLIANQAAGSENWTSEIESKDLLKKGFYNMEFTNQDSSLQPAIAAGSSADIDGVLFKFDSEEAIAGAGSIYWPTYFNQTENYDYWQDFIDQFNSAAPWTFTNPVPTTGSNIPTKTLIYNWFQDVIDQFIAETPWTFTNPAPETGDDLYNQAEIQAFFEDFIVDQISSETPWTFLNPVTSITTITSGTAYVVVKTDATAEFITTTLPDWNYAKKGYYGTSGERYVFECEYNTISLEYTLKEVIDGRIYK
jgi:hypothetical protein